MYLIAGVNRATEFPVRKDREVIALVVAALFLARRARLTHLAPLVADSIRPA